MRFSEVLEIKNGKNQRQVENPNGKYPIYGSGGVMGHADDYLCEAETVVIGRKGSINNPIFVEEPFWNVDTAFGLVANKDLLLPKYLYYFCINFNFEALNTTVTIPSLTKANLLQIEINIPSIAEQSDVVSKLDKIGNLIELRKQQLEELDQLVKSRFIELFGDPITNERKWQTLVWSNVLKIRNGRNQKAVENPNGQYPICGSGGIMGFADEYITEKNSVIIGRKGNINKPILMRERFWNVDTAFGLEPNEQILSVDYLFFYCLFFDFEQMNKAVTIPSLTKADLQNIVMPVPPIELQNQFSAFVEQVDKSKLAIQKSLEKLEILKKSLMQQYFG